MIKRIAITVTALALVAQAAAGDVWDELAKYEYGDEPNAGEAVEQLVQETPPAEYGKLEKGLIGVVASRDATQTGKAIACRMLQQVGTEACIPAVSKLLGDEILSHYARLVLERLKTAKADAAMRGALAGAPDQVKIGLLGSLGERRDTEAVPAVAALARSAKPAVAEAAIGALGEIGGKEAAEALGSLKPDDVLVPAQMRAMVDCASTLPAAEAAALSEMVLVGPYSPARIAALRALASANPAKAAPRIAAAIKGDDVGLRKGALGIVADTEGEGLTVAMVDLLDDLPADRKAGLVRALGNRGDRKALEPLTNLITSAADALRDAAITAVAKLGDAGTVPVLLKMADTDVLRGRVAEAISRMTAEGVDEALARALDDAGLRKAAIHAAVARGTDAAVPGLLKLVASDDAAMRKDAWAGVAALATAEHMDGVMKALVAATDEAGRAQAADAVRKIIGRVADKAACFEVIAGTYDRVPDATKAVILGLGSASGDAEALKLERQALASNNKELRGQAVRALAAWPNATAAQDLLRLAKGAEQKADRLLALRGYIRLAGMKEADLSGARRIEMLETAMDLADRPQEKKQVVSSLQNVKGIEALNMLKQYMDDPALQAEAEMAAANLIWDLRNRHTADVADVAQRLLESKNKTVVEKASRTMADLAKGKAFVRAWLVSPVYREKGKDGEAVHKTAFPPEKDGQGVEWKPLKKGVGKETINLEAGVAREERCCVYVKTTLLAPSTQSVRLGLGSDDGIKAWVNGTRVHENWVTRGVGPGQDTVKVDLKQGPNVLLLKVTNEGTHWGFSCAVSQPNGMPIKGLKVRAE
ncbi:MAG: HEAT repeat domain-containing protein [Phycisphaerae bacterium]